MHSAVARPYLTAGVALVGASVIAVAPLAPAPPHISLPSVRSAEVALAAAVNPLEAYLDLLNHTVGNLSSLGQTLLANPAPILQQILKNQFASATDLLAALQSSGSQLVNGIVTTVPQQVQEALANLAAGNIVGVGQNVVNIITQPVLLPFLTLLSGIQPLIEKPVANLLAVTQQFTTIVALSGIGVLEPIVSTINATAQAIQNVVDAGLSLNPVGLVSSIVAAPAVIADGLLNGFGFDGGVLTPGLGLVGALVAIRNTIAQALGAPPPVVAATTAAVSEAPAAAAKTVTLSTISNTTKTASKTDATSKSDSTTATSDNGSSSAAAGGSTDNASGAAASVGSSSETKDSSATGTTDPKSGTDTATKGDTTGKDDATGAKGSDSDSSSASTSKGDNTTKTGSDTKRGSSEKAGTAKAEKADK
jgi:hypothetical protein